MSNLPLSMRRASSSAFSASTTCSKSLTRPTMSPMPRMRDARPSGLNSSSLSSCSPMPRNLIGLDVISLTDSAAPPRASPSSFVMMMPSTSRRLLNGHRVEDEEDVAGLDLLVDVLELLHQGLVDREAAGGVEQDRVAALLH